MSISRCLSLTRTATAALLATSLLVGLSGCGGGGGGSSATTPVSGSVFAAPVNGADCEIQRSNGITVVDSISTDADGLFSVNVPDASLADDLMLVCSGGSYTDEASGSSQTAGTIAAYVAGGTLSSGADIHATPESTLIYHLVKSHGKTLAEANTTFQAAFGYTPDTTVAPTDATDPASGAGDDELLAGLHAAAFSQLAADIGLEPEQQFALLVALAQDLSDGALDGSDASGPVNIDDDDTLPLPVDIQNQFAGSMLKFHKDDSKNKTGLDNDKIGTLPFAKTALTSSYKIEYVPGMMAAMQGKTRFQIRLTDRANDQAVTGAAVALMPMMYMADMSHSTPVDGACTESGAAGTYDCTVYYLMASAMNGMSTGYWDLKVMVMVGMMGENTHFYPPVMMAMGDTARASLKGIDDKIGSMMGMPEARTYYLFKSSLSGMNNNHSFGLFIAAKASMMSYPAVFNPTTLNSGDMDYELGITSMSVEVSTDKSTWVSADGSSNDGYWTATGITGLTNGSPGTIYVRMNINGEQKTTNGQAPAGDGTNDYAVFTVTPGSM